MATSMTSSAAAHPTPGDGETLATLRRKLGFRAWQRGTREADLLIGTFADRCLAGFAADELYQFEHLLEEDDPVIDDWINGRQVVPREHDNNVFALLRQCYLASVA